MTSIRPQLAAQKYNEDITQGHLDNDGYIWAQPKIDGLRVLASVDLLPLSRSGKEHKLKPLRAWLRAHPSLRGVDGEVVTGHTYHEGSFRESMSGARAADGSREFTFFMFDYFLDSMPYLERYGHIAELYHRFGEFQEGDEYHAKLVLTPTSKLYTMEQINEYEEACIVQGWEGAMLRRNGPVYKFGRATTLEGGLTKLKRTEDSEAVVIGYEPWYQNNNTPNLSPLGYSTRTGHLAGLQPMERLGSWKCELLTDRTVKFDVGVMRGVSHADRDRLWADRDAYIGRIFKFAHQGYGGGYTKPRQPVFLNWRSAAEF